MLMRCREKFFAKSYEQACFCEGKKRMTEGKERGRGKKSTPDVVVIGVGEREFSSWGEKWVRKR